MKRILAYYLFIISIINSLNINANTIDEPQRTQREFVYSVQKNTVELEVKYKGEILLTHNDKDVASISPNGFLIVEQSSFGNRRRIEFVADAKGFLTKIYVEGKKEGDYNTDGKAFLESLLPDLIYKTTIGGKDRVLRIYKEKGMSEALVEAEKMRTRGKSNTTFVAYYNSNFNYPIANHNLYYKAIMDNVSMNEEELSDFIEAIKEINSNSSKGILLRQVLNKYKLDGNQVGNFLDATGTLSYNTERGNTLRLFQQKYPIDASNYQDYFRVIEGITINSEKGNVLKPLLESQKLENRVFIALCESTKRFTNQSESAAVLRVAVNYLPDDQIVTDSFLSAVYALSSTYRYLKDELNNIILDKEYLTRTKKTNETLIISTLKVVRNEDANTKKSTTLRKVHSAMTNSPELIEAYFGVIESMDNNMEVYNVLLELVKQHKLDKVGYLALFYSVEQLAKDDYMHGASAIIRATITNMPDDKQVIEQMFEALEEIDHDSGREEIIRLLCAENKATNNMGILKMLRIAGDIEGDIEKAISLTHISKVIPKGQEEITYLYKRLADELKSQYEYDRALAELTKI